WPRSMPIDGGIRGWSTSGTGWGDAGTAERVFAVCAAADRRGRDRGGGRHTPLGLDHDRSQDPPIRVRFRRLRAGAGRRSVGAEFVHRRPPHRAGDGRYRTRRRSDHHAHDACRFGERHRACRRADRGNPVAFSFYATKNLATGEGGMLTASPECLAQARVVSLHGMSRDAWKRYDKGGSWYYEVMLPGFKYNMTDIQAALGVWQLR